VSARCKLFVRGKHKKQLGGTHCLPAYLRKAIGRRIGCAILRDLRMKNNLLVRLHPIAKTGPLDLTKHGPSRMGAICVKTSSGCLRHHFSQEDSRDDRKSWKVVAKEFLVSRQRLRGFDLFARLQLKNFVDKYESHVRSKPSFLIKEAGTSYQTPR